MRLRGWWGCQPCLHPRQVSRYRTSFERSSRDAGELMATPRLVRIHYRKAKLDGADAGQTLQEALKVVMAGSLGQDARQRIFPITDDGNHKGCLNYSDPSGGSSIADIMHLDGRSSLPTWIHPTVPEPVAKVIPKELAAGEASLDEPAYILVKDNHVAAIERLGFRNSSMERYLNSLIKAGGALPSGSQWSLNPKIELESTGGLTGAIKKVIIRPKAAMQGGAASEAPTPTVQGVVNRRMSDIFAQGWRVLDMVRAAGGDEAEIEKLRQNLSSDLALKARLEITVAAVRRKSEAELQAGAIEKAFAEMASDSDIRLVSSDGKTDGKLIQLVHTAEVMETGGLIDWQAATYALISALNAWAAKGSIDLK